MKIKFKKKALKNSFLILLFSILIVYVFLFSSKSDAALYFPEAINLTELNVTHKPYEVIEYNFSESSSKVNSSLICGIAYSHDGKGGQLETTQYQVYETAGTNNTIMMKMNSTDGVSQFWISQCAVGNLSAGSKSLFDGWDNAKRGNSIGSKWGDPGNIANHNGSHYVIVNYSETFVNFTQAQINTSLNTTILTITETNYSANSNNINFISIKTLSASKETAGFVNEFGNCGGADNGLRAGFPAWGSETTIGNLDLLCNPNIVSRKIQIINSTIGTVNISLENSTFYNSSIKTGAFQSPLMNLQFGVIHNSPVPPSGSGMFWAKTYITTNQQLQEARLYSPEATFIWGAVILNSTLNEIPLIKNISIMPTTIYRNSIVNVTFNITDDTNTTLNVTAALYRNGAVNFTYTNLTYRVNTSMTINATPTRWSVNETLYWNITAGDGTDNSGMNSTATITVLNRLPTISLNQPANNSAIENLPNVTFSLNYSDLDLDTGYCNTTYNGTILNESRLSDGVVFNYTFVFPFNQYNRVWNVSCWDGYNRTNSNNYNVSLLNDLIAPNLTLTLSRESVSSHYQTLEINITQTGAEIVYLNITNSDGTLLTRANNLSNLNVFIGFNNQTVLGNATVWVVANDTLGNKNITSKQYNLTDTDDIVLNSVTVPSVTNVGNNLTFSADIVEHNVSSAILNFSGFDYTYSLTRISGNNFSVAIVTNTTFPTTINYNLTANDSLNNKASLAGSFSVKYPALSAVINLTMDNQYLNEIWTFILYSQSETLQREVNITLTAPNGSIEINNTNMTKMYRDGENEAWNITYYARRNGTYTANFTILNNINNRTNYGKTVIQTATLEFIPSRVVKQVIDSQTELIEQQIAVYSDDIHHFRLNATALIANQSEMFPSVNLTPNNATINVSNASEPFLYTFRMHGNGSTVDGQYLGNASFTLLELSENYAVPILAGINPPAAFLTIMNSSSNVKCAGISGFGDPCYSSYAITQGNAVTVNVVLNNSGGFNASGCSLISTDDSLKPRISSNQYSVSLNSTTAASFTFVSNSIGIFNGQTFLNCSNASSLGYGQASNNSIFNYFQVSPAADVGGGSSGAGGGINPLLALALGNLTKTIIYSNVSFILEPKEMSHFVLYLPFKETKKSWLFEVTANKAVTDCISSGITDSSEDTIICSINPADRNRIMINLTLANDREFSKNLRESFTVINEANEAAIFEARFSGVNLAYYIPAEPFDAPDFPLLFKSENGAVTGIRVLGIITFLFLLAAAIVALNLILRAIGV